MRASVLALSLALSPAVSFAQHVPCPKASIEYYVTTFGTKSCFLGGVQVSGFSALLTTPNGATSVGGLADILVTPGGVGFTYSALNPVGFDGGQGTFSLDVRYFMKAQILDVVTDIANGTWEL
jgi:hypothetical protein